MTNARDDNKWIEDRIEKALAETRPMVSQADANERIQAVLNSKNKEAK